MAKYNSLCMLIEVLQKQGILPIKNKKENKMQTQKITEKGITKQLVFFLGINVIKHVLANKTETEEGRLRLIEGIINTINQLLEHVDCLIDTEVTGVTDEKKI